MHQSTKKDAENYLSQLQKGEAEASTQLQARLNKLSGGKTLQNLSVDEFLHELINSKKYMIFAESGNINYQYWNETESKILGKISVNMAVDIYDNGNWYEPEVHTDANGQPKPLKGHLCYVAGALLDTTTGTFDEDEVTTVDKNGKKQLDQEKFTDFYEKRLLPVLDYINKNSTEKNPAFVTIPGIGEGFFGGNYGTGGQNIVGDFLQTALKQILEQHGQDYPNIKGIYYSPSTPRNAGTKNIKGCDFIVSNGCMNEGAIQLLSKPETFDKKYKDYTLFKLVAWDHYSFPGNDFFANDRTTDDGVSAAATNSMQVLSRIQGEYQDGRFLPKDNSNTTWKNLFKKNNIELTGEPIICKQELKLQKTYLTTNQHAQSPVGSIIGAVIGAIAGGLLGYFVAPLLLPLIGITVSALSIGLIVTATALVVGLIVGIAVGCVGKWIDNGINSSKQESQQKLNINQDNPSTLKSSGIKHSNQVRTDPNQVSITDTKTNEAKQISNQTIA